MKNRKEFTHLFFTKSQMLAWIRQAGMQFGQNGTVSRQGVTCGTWTYKRELRHPWQIVCL